VSDAAADILERHREKVRDRVRRFRERRKKGLTKPAAACTGCGASGVKLKTIRLCPKCYAANGKGED
jgi:hypothetical protein